jgi:hypothetical protein
MNVDPAQVRAIFLEAVEKHSPETWEQFAALELWERGLGQPL